MGAAGQAVNNAPAAPVAPPRAGRNSRFGPVPPAAGVGGAVPPPLPPAAGGFGRGAGWEEAEDREPGAAAHDPDHGAAAHADGPALRPAFGGGPAWAEGAGAAPPTRAAGGVPPTQRPGGAQPVGAPRPGGRAGTTKRRALIIAAGSAALVVGGGAWALAQGPGGSPRTVVPNAVGPQPTQLAGANKCVVSYAVWSDDGGRFKAAVTIANRDTKAVKNWKLWFLMPGDQVVSGNGKLHLDQQARAVTVETGRTLNPQATETMQFTGRYKDSNAAPMVFELGGQACETYVSPKPGEPSRPVEHLTNGTVRLGPVPSEDSPVPGISIDPSGVAVPVPVTSTEPGKPGTSTPPSSSPTPITGPTDDDDDAPPPEPPSTSSSSSSSPAVDQSTGTTTPPPMESDPPTDPADQDDPPSEFG
ncbi:cellulose binding domain-containing protein [Actinoplanes sp. NPDC049548]|uniref:cellulose binding domain-containing protein n=1 Tax=Actinoplanes sp. NPDC049548 TaxID=3155152 RepID=UPI003434B42E